MKIHTSEAHPVLRAPRRPPLLSFTLPLPLATAMPACGGSPPPPAPSRPRPGRPPGGGGPPPPAEPPRPRPAEAAPPPEPKAEGPALDSAAVDQCLAAATAKRARFSGEPPKLTARHVLIKYKGAKNA